MPTKFGKSAILWADPENKHKLLVAIFAASEPKFTRKQYEDVAKYFGNDTTWSAMQHQILAVNNEAKKLKKEVDGDDNGEDSAGTAIPSIETPAGIQRLLNAKDKVIGGRVTKKSTSKTDKSKKPLNLNLKLEKLVSDKPDVGEDGGVKGNVDNGVKGYGPVVGYEETEMNGYGGTNAFM